MSSALGGYAVGPAALGASCWDPGVSRSMNGVVAVSAAGLGRGSLKSCAVCHGRRVVVLGTLALGIAPWNAAPDARRISLGHERMRKGGFSAPVVDPVVHAVAQTSG